MNINPYILNETKFCYIVILENEKESVCMMSVKEEDKELFQNNIPQGAIVESRPHVPPVYPKQEGNHNSNSLLSAVGAMEIKAPQVLDGMSPVPYSTGMARPMMPIDPQQMRMFYMHRSNLRSQHPPIKPPTGASGILQSPKHPNINGGPHVIFENAPILQVTKVSSHESVPSNATSITVSMNTLSNVDTLPSFDKSILGYSVPTGVVSSQTGNNAASATRPVTLALPASTAICNSTLTYSVAPVTSVSTVMSMDISKGNIGTAVPPLQPIIPSTAAVDSNAYTAYHNGQTGSASFCTNFPGQGGPVSVTPVQTPGPSATHTPVPLATIGSNVSTPLQTPVTGVSQLPHTPAHISTPPVASQSTQPPNHSAPSCSTCGCNGLCTTAASASNTGYPQVMWHHMFPGYPPLGVMPVTSNGLVPPNLPYSHPLQTMNLPNGINPDVVYNNQPPNFNIVQQSEGVSNAVFVTSTNTGSFSTATPSHAVPTYTESTNGKGKVINCYNCGEAGHRAVDCRELNMESLTHNGKFYLFKRHQ